jgi:hypothetical protein
MKIMFVTVKEGMLPLLLLLLLLRGCLGERCDCFFFQKATTPLTKKHVFSVVSGSSHVVAHMIATGGLHGR